MLSEDTSLLYCKYNNSLLLLMFENYSSFKRGIQYVQ